MRFVRLFLAMAILAVAAFAETPHTSSPFQGPKANKGTVMHSRSGAQSILTLSDDFVVPDTPDPHWQVVDSKGKIYRLQALKVKEGLSNKQITLPSFVPNVAKVQIWCAFAETLLGEASFSSPVK
jgi:hypothetical protein